MKNRFLYLEGPDTHMGRRKRTTIRMTPISVSIDAQDLKSNVNGPMDDRLPRNIDIRTNVTALHQTFPNNLF